MYEEELKKIKSLYKDGVYEQDFYLKKILDETVFDSYEKFQKIPLTYKNELRETTAFERTGCKQGEIYGIFSSSGTTGEKTYYIYSKDDKKVHEEFVRTFYEELEITSSDIGGICAPVDTGVMAHTMMWQFTTMGAGYTNCPKPSPQNIAELVDAIPITVIATRPDIVSTLAYKDEWTQKARNSSVKKMILGGGFLSEQRRKLLEKTWDAQVYNVFGMSEMFGPMAAECRQKNGQHYLNQYLMVEILNPETKQPVKPGEAGIAVYTTLWRKGFPLLRYWTDDLMRIDYSRCICGSKLPRFFYIGRMGDCLKCNDKWIFPRMVEEITIKYGFIWDYQIVEKKDSVEIRVEKPQNMDASVEMEQELFRLIERTAKFIYMLPGELQYKGHGKRFVKG